MTAQQQLDAFIAHCGAIRHGYTFSFKKKSSSLRYFIAALEKSIADNRVKPLLEHKHDGIIADLKQRSPKDHVKYLPAIKSLAAVWGTAKDYVRLQVADNLPNSTLYWNLVTGALGTVPTNIAISSRYPGYHVNVARHLIAISNTTAGGLMLTALANNAHFNVSIVDHPLTNQCGTQGLTTGMNRVAQELYSELTTKIGDVTKATLLRMPTGGRTAAAWLAAQINQTPWYQLKGVPAVAPCNIGVTEGQVQAWVGGRGIWDDYGNDRECDQIKNAIIIALYPQSDPGTGASSMVNYSMGTINPLNEERPPAIGLAHELVHAYYSMRGEQPGYEVESATTVLFEYRCVGLGPWHGAAISENAIRTDWPAALPHFDDDDVRNLKALGLRQYYSAP